MAMVSADGSSQSFGGLTAQISWFGLRVGGHPALSLHSSNEPGELSQWLCHDDSTINIVVVIIIIIIIIHFLRSLSVSICIIIQTSILVFCFYFFSFLWLYPYICCLLYCDSFELYSCMYLICYLVLWPPDWINATTNPSSSSSVA